MSLRQSINQQCYQQAVKFSKNFAKAERAELLSEAQERYEFEQQQLQYSPPLTQKTSFNTSKYLPFILTVVTFIAVICYWQTGRWQRMEHAAELALIKAEQQAVSELKANDRYILSLQSQLRQDPNNGDKWFELGQAYTLNNEFNAAFMSYQNAQKILGDKPAILGAIATADYYQQGQRLSTQAKTWIQQALVKDPTENASLLLLASDAFLNNQYNEALLYWRAVLDSDNEAINRKAIIQSMRLAEQLLHNH